jgi:hypothetical protein
MESVLDVIAERCLTLNTGEEEREIRISLGRPYQEPDRAYFCPFRISGMGEDYLNRAGGVDSIQALQLALVMIGATLSTISEHLKWDGEPYTGFPSNTDDTVLGAE